MTNSTRLVISLAALFLGLSLISTLAESPLRKVTVVGAATIKVVPDQMLWTVQIGVNDSSLAKAKMRHDESLDAALKYIKAQGDGVKELQTDGIRFDKNIDAPENSIAAAKPYSCSTQFTFTLTDFDRYGPIVDTLSKLDGVQIESVEYASSKDEATKRSALKQALQNAHDKASDLAITANCYIDKPLEIVEGTPENGPRPMFMAARAGSDSGTPAAVPGQLEISATVTATYDLYYK